MESSITFRTISAALLALPALSVTQTASADTVEVDGTRIGETVNCCSAPIAANQVSNNFIDASGTQIDFAHLADIQFASGSFDAYKFVFSSAGALYAIAAVGPSSTLTPVSLFFGPDKVDINFPGLVIDMTFVPAAPVPLPNSAWLLFSGLVGLALVRKISKGVDESFCNVAA